MAASYDYDYDLFVIGGGSGGVRAARIASGSGARVGLAEEYRMGGTCVIRGCVPKKLMVYGSAFADAFKDAEGYGWTVGEAHFQPSKMMENIAAEVTRLEGIYMSGQENAGVSVYKQRAEFVDSHTLLLKPSGETITAEKILIATGGHPWRPDPDELEGVERTITSNEIFDLRSLPDHITIAGGGYIALEFAHVFARLGVETTVVYRGDKVLRGFDEDVRDQVQEGLHEAGIQLITGNVFRRISDSGNAVRPNRIHLSGGDTFDTDVIVMAVGRRPNTNGLGCAAAGVALDKNGAVIVDSFSKTNVDNIWAVGDVTDRMHLTPVAIREGHAFADTEFLGQPHYFDHQDVATAVFTQPEVGTIGLTEDEARARYGDVDIYMSRFRPMKNILAGNPSRMLMKLVVSASDDRVRGVHIVGDGSGEMIQMAAIAVKMGATKADFDRTCAVHPTASEELVTLRNKTR